MRTRARQLVAGQRRDATVRVTKRCDTTTAAVPGSRAASTASRAGSTRAATSSSDSPPGGRNVGLETKAAMLASSPYCSVISAGVKPYQSPRPTSRSPSSGVGAPRPHASATRSAPYTARARGEQKTRVTGTLSVTPAAIIAAAARASASPFVESGTSAPPYTAPGLSPLLTSPCRTHTMRFGGAAFMWSAAAVERSVETRVSMHTNRRPALSTARRTAARCRLAILMWGMIGARVLVHDI